MSIVLPKGHHIVTPGALICHANKVLKFIEDVFKGELLERYDGPDGTCAHAEILIGDSAVMLGEAPSEKDALPAILSVYVGSAEEVDSTYKAALEAGATSEREPADQFYGHRSATVKDVGGNLWSISAVIEQLTPEEIDQRMAGQQ